MASEYPHTRSAYKVPESKEELFRCMKKMKKEGASWEEVLALAGISKVTFL